MAEQPASRDERRTAAQPVPLATLRRGAGRVEQLVEPAQDTGLSDHDIGRLLDELAAETKALDHIAVAIDEATEPALRPPALLGRVALLGDAAARLSERLPSVSPLAVAIGLAGFAFVASLSMTGDATWQSRLAPPRVVVPVERADRLRISVDGLGLEATNSRILSAETLFAGGGPTAVPGLGVEDRTSVSGRLLAGPEASVSVQPDLGLSAALNMDGAFAGKGNQLSRNDVLGGATGQFMVQLGSFRLAENAESLVRTLTAQGFRVFMNRWQGWYVVRVGYFGAAGVADAAAARLKSLTGLRPLVRSL